MDRTLANEGYGDYMKLKQQRSQEDADEDPPTDTSSPSLEQRGLVSHSPDKRTSRGQNASPTTMSSSPSGSYRDWRGFLEPLPPSGSPSPTKTPRPLYPISTSFSPGTPATLPPDTPPSTSTLRSYLSERSAASSFTSLGDDDLPDSPLKNKGAARRGRVPAARPLGARDAVKRYNTLPQASTGSGASATEARRSNSDSALAADDSGEDAYHTALEESPTRPRPSRPLPKAPGAPTMVPTEPSTPVIPSPDLFSITPELSSSKNPAPVPGKSPGRPPVPDSPPTTPRKRRAGEADEASDESLPGLKRVATAPASTSTTSSTPTIRQGFSPWLARHASESHAKVSTNIVPIKYKALVDDREIVERMAKYDIPSMVRHWIARALSYNNIEGFGWHTLTDDVLFQLQGLNVDLMPRLLDVFSLSSKAKRYFSPRDYEVWQQADLETAAEKEGLGRSLGCLEDPREYIDSQGRTHVFPPNWYGGRIEYRVRLASTGAGAKRQYRLLFEKPKIGRSKQFTRLVGSENCILLQGEKKEDSSQPNKKVESFTRLEKDLLSGHCLGVLGKAFRIVCAKEGKVYLGAFESPYSRYGSSLSLLEYVRIVNNPDRNQAQVLSKYVNRMELPFSTSIPAVALEACNILEVPDVKGSGNGPNSIKTDGHGYANASFFIKATPRSANGMLSKTAFTLQGRIGMCKGLWSLHPDKTHHDDNAPPKIWITPSQRKVFLSAESEQTHLIFNRVRPPRVSRPSLQRQSILNLSAHLIPSELFGEILEENLREKLLPLIKWEGDGTALALALFLAKSERLGAKRLAKAAGGESRALGYSRELLDEPIDSDIQPMDVDSDSDDGDDCDITDGNSDDDSSPMRDPLSTWNPNIVERDPISGLPDSLQERLVEMLCAGFEPGSVAFMQDQLKIIWNDTISKTIGTLRLDIPDGKGLQGWIIPDPTGQLMEGQIYFRSSKGMEDPVTRIMKNVLEGPVIIGRSPVRLLSDIQRMEAVDIPELSRYQDVIVLSIQGDESSASLLSGGDYDGDTAFLIWDARILQSFTNFPRVPVPDIDDALVPPPETVAAWLERFRFSTKTSDQEFRLKQRESDLQRALVEYGLKEHFTGIYSNLHEVSAYWDGYNHPKTVRLGAICNSELDARKHGRGVREEVLRRDQRANKERPSCFPKAATGGDTRQEGDDAKPTRQRTGPEAEKPHVLEVLQEVGKRLQIEYDKHWEDQVNSAKKKFNSFEVDPDIHAYYAEREACARGFPKGFSAPDLIEPDRAAYSAMQLELCALKDRVQSTFDKYMEETVTLLGAKKTSQTRNSWRQRSIKLSRELFDLSTMVPPIRLHMQEDARKFMAAYCWVYVAKDVHPIRRDGKAKVEFPFQMAFSRICAIKAEARSDGNGGVRSAVGAFADCLVLSEKIGSAALKDLMQE